MLSFLYRRSLTLLTLSAVFFTYAFENSSLHAVEMGFKEQVAFGSLESPIETYLFTDWDCSTCRRIEPIVYENLPDILKDGKMIFVDFITHQESIDFTAYNLAFMMHNKPQYLQLRAVLNELALKTKIPKDTEIQEATNRIGVAYQPLSYSEVTLGIKLFKHLARQFNVDKIPTLVIVNTEKKIGKKLVGSDEIHTKNIKSALQSLK